MIFIAFFVLSFSLADGFYSFDIENEQKLEISLIGKHGVVLFGDFDVNDVKIEFKGSVEICTSHIFSVYDENVSFYSKKANFFLWVDPIGLCNGTNFYIDMEHRMEVILNDPHIIYPVCFYQANHSLIHTVDSKQRVFIEQILLDNRIININLGKKKNVFENISLIRFNESVEFSAISSGSHYPHCHIRHIENYILNSNDTILAPVATEYHCSSIYQEKIYRVGVASIVFISSAILLFLWKSYALLCEVQEQDKDLPFEKEMRSID